MLAGKRRLLVIGFSLSVLGLLCSLGCRSVQPHPWPTHAEAQCAPIDTPDVHRQSLSDMRRYRRQTIENEVAAKLSEARSRYSSFGGQ